MLPHTCRQFPRWVLLLGLATAPLCAGDGLSEADKAVGAFVSSQIETAQLETEWRTQRELLESMVAAARERATLLEEKRDLTRSKTAKDREELATLRNNQQRARDELKAYDVQLARLCAELVALLRDLPPHLAGASELAIRSLNDPKLPAGERTLLAMNLLNRCEQFNRTVTVTTDILSLDGEPAEKSFETIYWGLSHGYALDRSSRKAWLGRPGPGGWQWAPQPDAFAEIAQLIAIGSEKADPVFVSAPVIVERTLAAPR